MSLTMRGGVLAGAAALTLTGISFADTTTDASTDELRAQLNEALSRIEQLESATNDEWLTEQRADEIRGLVADVLADADTRASLLQSGASAGYDRGFIINSADGNYMLRVNGQLQVRWVYNTQDSAAPGDSDRWGFENRRAKLRFSGHIVDPSWKYVVQGAFANAGGAGGGGDFEAEDVYVAKTFDNGWTLRGGQFKSPFLREELVGSSRQLTVERSLVNERFTTDRTQGLELNYAGDNLRFAVMGHDGQRTDNLPALSYDTEFAMTGRLEWLAVGNWSQFEDHTSWRGEEYGAMVGIAANYEVQEYGTGDSLFIDVNGDGIDDTPNDNEVETFGLTVDASVEGGGWNLFGAFVYQSLDPNFGGSLISTGSSYRAATSSTTTGRASPGTSGATMTSPARPI